jgi:ribosomal protein L37AE/L43A
MKIKEITEQSRRDFTAIYVCEHCNTEEKGYGYDDDNFHRNVIPRMPCKKCGKTANEDYRPMGTKYSADTVV